MTTRPDAKHLSVSDAVAVRIKEARGRRGWSAKQLAEQCAVRGLPRLTHSVLNNIESGRPDKDGQRKRDITVDELLALAVILDVAPTHLLGLPVDGATSIEILPSCGVSNNDDLQQWIRGDKPLPQTDERLYFASALEQLPPRDDQRTAPQSARAVIQEQAKELLSGFHAEAERLAATATARLEAIVAQAENAVANGATPDDVVEILKRAEQKP